MPYDEYDLWDLFPPQEFETPVNPVGATGKPRQVRKRPKQQHAVFDDPGGFWASTLGRNFAAEAFQAYGLDINQTRQLMEQRYGTAAYSADLFSSKVVKRGTKDSPPVTAYEQTFNILGIDRQATYANPFLVTPSRPNPITGRQDRIGVVSRAQATHLTPEAEAWVNAGRELLPGEVAGPDEFQFGSNVARVEDILGNVPGYALSYDEFGNPAITGSNLTSAKVSKRAKTAIGTGKGAFYNIPAVESVLQTQTGTRDVASPVRAVLLQKGIMEPGQALWDRTITGEVTQFDSLTFSLPNEIPDDWMPNLEEGRFYNVEGGMFEVAPGMRERVAGADMFKLMSFGIAYGRKEVGGGQFVNTRDLIMQIEKMTGNALPSLKGAQGVKAGGAVVEHLSRNLNLRYASGERIENVAMMAEISDVGQALAAVAGFGLTESELTEAIGGTTWTASSARKLMQYLEDKGMIQNISFDQRMYLGKPGQYTERMQALLDKGIATIGKTYEENGALFGDVTITAPAIVPLPGRANFGINPKAEPAYHSTKLSAEEAELIRRSGPAGAARIAAVEAISGRALADRASVVGASMATQGRAPGFMAVGAEQILQNWNLVTAKAEDLKKQNIPFGLEGEIDEYGERAHMLRAISEMAGGAGIEIDPAKLGLEGERFFLPDAEAMMRRFGDDDIEGQLWGMPHAFMGFMETAQRIQSSTTETVDPQLVARAQSQMEKLRLQMNLATSGPEARRDILALNYGPQVGGPDIQVAPGFAPGEAWIPEDQLTKMYSSVWGKEEWGIDKFAQKYASPRDMARAVLMGEEEEYPMVYSGRWPNTTAEDTSIPARLLNLKQLRKRTGRPDLTYDEANRLGILQSAEQIAASGGDSDRDPKTMRQALEMTTRAEQSRVNDLVTRLAQAHPAGELAARVGDIAKMATTPQGFAQSLIDTIGTVSVTDIARVAQEGAQAKYVMGPAYNVERRLEAQMRMLGSGDEAIGAVRNALGAPLYMAAQDMEKLSPAGRHLIDIFGYNAGTHGYMDRSKNPEGEPASLNIVSGSMGAILNLAKEYNMPAEAVAELFEVGGSKNQGLLKAIGAGMVSSVLPALSHQGEADIVRNSPLMEMIMTAGIRKQAYEDRTRRKESGGFEQRTDEEAEAWAKANFNTENFARFERGRDIQKYLRGLTRSESAVDMPISDWFDTLEGMASFGYLGEVGAAQFERAKRAVGETAERGVRHTPSDEPGALPLIEAHRADQQPSVNKAAYEARVAARAEEDALAEQRAAEWRANYEAQKQTDAERKIVWNQTYNEARDQGFDEETAIKMADDAGSSLGQPAPQLRSGVEATPQVAAQVQPASAQNAPPRVARQVFEGLLTEGKYAGIPVNFTSNITGRKGGRIAGKYSDKGGISIDPEYAMEVWREARGAGKTVIESEEQRAQWLLAHEASHSRFQGEANTEAMRLLTERQANTTAYAVAGVPLDVIQANFGAEAITPEIQEAIDWLQGSSPAPTPTTQTSGAGSPPAPPAPPTAPPAPSQPPSGGGGKKGSGRGRAMSDWDAVRRTFKGMGFSQDEMREIYEQRQGGAPVRDWFSRDKRRARGDLLAEIDRYKRGYKVEREVGSQGFVKKFKYDTAEQAGIRVGQFMQYDESERTAIMNVARKIQAGEEIGPDDMSYMTQAKDLVADIEAVQAGAKDVGWFYRQSLEIAEGIGDEEFVEKVQSELEPYKNFDSTLLPGFMEAQAISQDIGYKVGEKKEFGERYKTASRAAKRAFGSSGGAGRKRAARNQGLAYGVAGVAMGRFSSFEELQRYTVDEGLGAGESGILTKLYRGNKLTDEQSRRILEAGGESLQGIALGMYSEELDTTPPPLEDTPQARYLERYQRKAEQWRAKQDSTETGAGSGIDIKAEKRAAQREYDAERKAMGLSRKGWALSAGIVGIQGGHFGSKGELEDYILSEGLGTKDAGILTKLFDGKDLSGTQSLRLREVGGGSLQEIAAGLAKGAKQTGTLEEQLQKVTQTLIDSRKALAETSTKLSSAQKEELEQGFVATAQKDVRKIMEKAQEEGGFQSVANLMGTSAFQQFEDATQGRITFQGALKGARSLFSPFSPTTAMMRAVWRMGVGTAGEDMEMAAQSGMQQLLSASATGGQAAMGDLSPMGDIIARRNQQMSNRMNAAYAFQQAWGWTQGEGNTGLLKAIGGPALGAGAAVGIGMSQLAATIPGLAGLAPFALPAAVAVSGLAAIAGGTSYAINASESTPYNYVQAATENMTMDNPNANLFSRIGAAASGTLRSFGLAFRGSSQDEYAERGMAYLQGDYSTMNLAEREASKTMAARLLRERNETFSMFSEQDVMSGMNQMYAATGIDPNQQYASQRHTNLLQASMTGNVDWTAAQNMSVQLTGGLGATEGIAYRLREQGQYQQKQSYMAMGNLSQARQLGLLSQQQVTELGATYGDVINTAAYDWSSQMTQMGEASRTRSLATNRMQIAEQYGANFLSPVLTTPEEMEQFRQDYIAGNIPLTEGPISPDSIDKSSFYGRQRTLTVQQRELNMAQQFGGTIYRGQRDVGGGQTVADYFTFKSPVQWQEEELQRNWDRTLEDQSYQWNQMQVGRNWQLTNRAWEIQDFNTGIARSMTQRGWRDEDMQISYNRGMQNLSWSQEDMSASWRSMQSNKDYQRWQLDFSQRQATMQRGWQLEDFSTQRATNQLQYGWQMEDIEESLRYATGRQRRQLLKQRNRATIMEGIQEGQLSTQEDRASKTWEMEQESFEKRRQHLEEENKYAEESWQRQRGRLEQQRKWLTEDYNRDRERNSIKDRWQNEDWAKESARREERIKKEDDEWQVSVDRHSEINKRNEEDHKVAIERLEEQRVAAEQLKKILQESQVIEDEIEASRLGLLKAESDAMAALSEATSGMAQMSVMLAIMKQAQEIGAPAALGELAKKITSRGMIAKFMLNGG